MSIFVWVLIKANVVVVIKMGAYYPDFMVSVLILGGRKCQHSLVADVLNRSGFTCTV